MKFLREYTISTHAPAGGATEAQAGYIPCNQDFYSRPCGRGDGGGARAAHGDVVISTHAPAGGATVALSANALREVFLLTPLREGRRKRPTQNPYPSRFLLTPLREGRPRRATDQALYILHFYSRPCGRGDGTFSRRRSRRVYFYSRPCGRGDKKEASDARRLCEFLLTPLREGRRSRCLRTERRNHFYSRPCGRGDLQGFYARPDSPLHFYSRPCGRGDMDDPQL